MRCRVLPILVAVLLGGCGAARAPGPPDAPAPAGTSTPAAPVAAPAGPPRWIDDDVPAARAQALAEGKVLLVDAWAPWCHTCLSMQQEVLHRPELGAYADRVVFAAADTDRPVNAGLVARYAVEVWPTFFVVDPAADRVLAVHGGAASLEELTRVLDGALALRASGAPGVFEGALAEASAAYAARRFADAAAIYERAAALGHPRASEALMGAIRSRKRAGDVEGCVTIAEAGLERVHGAAMAADFAYYARSCAAELPAGDRRFSLSARARERLREITSDPPPGATVDDRADALSMLAAAEREWGDEEAAKAATLARIALLDEAAARAGSLREAAAYDAMRAWAYLDAGRPDDAVRMLEERTRQLPGEYEAFARLASVLATIDPGRALAPLRRAIELSYGPRRVRYIEQEAALLARTGDHAGRVAALRRVVDAQRALGPGHADAARLARAEAQLAEAERQGGAGGGTPAASGAAR